MRCTKCWPMTWKFSEMPSNLIQSFSPFRMNEAVQCSIMFVPLEIRTAFPCFSNKKIPTFMRKISITIHHSMSAATMGIGRCQRSLLLKAAVSMRRITCILVPWIAVQLGSMTRIYYSYVKPVSTIKFKIFLISIQRVWVNETNRDGLRFIFAGYFPLLLTR